MGLSEVSLIALTKLTPQILKAPYYEFFHLFSGERPETHGIENKNNLTTKKLFDEYYNHCWDCLDRPEWKNKKTKLKKIFESLCARLDGIFWNNSEVGISNINWEELDKFGAGLKDWKNVGEHKVRWAIFNKFNSLSGDNKSITVKDLETMLEGFEINIDKMIRKILAQKWVTVKISYNVNEIVIDHKVGDPAIANYITKPMEFMTRIGGEVDDGRILELLDEGAYTQTEVTQFLDLKKSAVSKIWNRLGEEEGSNEIKFVNRGPRGSAYYTTNCENCFLGKERKTCRKESIDEMILILKNSFGLDASRDSFEKIQFNQGLLKLRRILREAERVKDTRLDDNFNQVVATMFQSIFTKFSERALAKGDYAFGMSDILERLPFLFGIGFAIGQASGVGLTQSLGVEIAKRANIKPGTKLTKEKMKEIERILLEETNRIYSLNSK